MGRNKRFITVHKEGISLSTAYEIVVDRETGVNYLIWKSSYSGSITPLLDADGKLIVTKK